MLRLRVDGRDGLFEVEVPQVVVEALDEEPAEEEDDEERAHHEEHDHLQTNSIEFVMSPRLISCLPEKKDEMAKMIEIFE